MMKRQVHNFGTYDISFNGYPSYFLNIPLPYAYRSLSEASAILSALSSIVSEIQQAFGNENIVVYGGATLRTHLVDVGFSGRYRDALHGGVATTNDLDFLVKDRETLTRLCDRFKHILEPMGYQVSAPTKIPTDEDGTFTIKQTVLNVGNDKARLFSIDITSLEGKPVYQEMFKGIDVRPVALYDQTAVFPLISYSNLLRVLFKDITKKSDTQDMPRRRKKAAQALQVFVSKDTRVKALLLECLGGSWQEKLLLAERGEAVEPGEGHLRATEQPPEPLLLTDNASVDNTVQISQGDSSSHELVAETLSGETETVLSNKEALLCAEPTIEPTIETTKKTIEKTTKEPQAHSVSGRDKKKRKKKNRTKRKAKETEKPAQAREIKEAVVSKSIAEEEAKPVNDQPDDKAAFTDSTDKLVERSESAMPEQVVVSSDSQSNHGDVESNVSTIAKETEITTEGTDAEPPPTKARVKRRQRKKAHRKRVQAAKVKTDEETSTQSPVSTEPCCSKTMTSLTVNSEAAVSASGDSVVSPTSSSPENTFADNTLSDKTTQTAPLVDSVQDLPDLPTNLSDTFCCMTPLQAVISPVIVENSVSDDQWYMVNVPHRTQGQMFLWGALKNGPFKVDKGVLIVPGQKLPRVVHAGLIKASGLNNPVAIGLLAITEAVQAPKSQPYLTVQLRRTARYYEPSRLLCAHCMTDETHPDFDPKALVTVYKQSGSSPQIDFPVRLADSHFFSRTAHAVHFSLSCLYSDGQSDEHTSQAVSYLLPVLKDNNGQFNIGVLGVILAAGLAECLPEGWEGQCNRSPIARWVSSWDGELNCSERIDLPAWYADGMLCSWKNSKWFKFFFLTLDKENRASDYLQTLHSGELFGHREHWNRAYRHFNKYCLREAPYFASEPIRQMQKYHEQFSALNFHDFSLLVVEKNALSNHVMSTVGYLKEVAHDNPDDSTLSGVLGRAKKQWPVLFPAGPLREGQSSEALIERPEDIGLAIQNNGITLEDLYLINTHLPGHPSARKLGQKLLFNGLRDARATVKVSDSQYTITVPDQMLVHSFAYWLFFTAAKLGNEEAHLLLFRHSKNNHWFSVNQHLKTASLRFRQARVDSCLFLLDFQSGHFDPEAWCTIHQQSAHNKKPPKERVYEGEESPDYLYFDLDEYMQKYSRGNTQSDRSKSYDYFKRHLEFAHRSSIDRPENLVSVMTGAVQTMNKRDKLQLLSQFKKIKTAPPISLFVYDVIRRMQGAKPDESIRLAKLVLGDKPDVNVLSRGHKGMLIGQLVTIMTRWLSVDDTVIEPFLKSLTDYYEENLSKEIPLQLLGILLHTDALFMNLDRVKLIANALYELNQTMGLMAYQYLAEWDLNLLPLLISRKIDYQSGIKHPPEKEVLTTGLIRLVASVVHSAKDKQSVRKPFQEAMRLLSDSQQAEVKTALAKAERLPESRLAEPLSAMPAQKDNVEMAIDTVVKRLSSEPCFVDQKLNWTGLSDDVRMTIEWLHRQSHPFGQLLWMLRDDLSGNDGFIRHVDLQSMVYRSRLGLNLWNSLRAPERQSATLSVSELERVRRFALMQHGHEINTQWRAVFEPLLEVSGVTYLKNLTDVAVTSRNTRFPIDVCPASGLSLQDCQSLVILDVLNAYIDARYLSGYYNSYNFNARILQQRVKQSLLYFPEEQASQRGELFGWILNPYEVSPQTLAGFSVDDQLMILISGFLQATSSLDTKENLASLYEWVEQTMKADNPTVTGRYLAMHPLIYPRLRAYSHILHFLEDRHYDDAALEICRIGIFEHAMTEDPKGYSDFVIGSALPYLFLFSPDRLEAAVGHFLDELSQVYKNASDRTDVHRCINKLLNLASDFSNTDQSARVMALIFEKTSQWLKPH